MTQDVGVFFELYRPSDGAVSDPKAFRYKPSGKTRLGKRARFEAPLAIRFDLSMEKRMPVKNMKMKFRSRPLPLAGTLTNEGELAATDQGLNLNNIIDDLMRNPE